ncbi:histidine-type phosphatase [Nostoc sp.]|uniref:histidine-type phosphatase n=1 Tax=Nostoc sp. TaxID=1180 RepID=UPI002FF5C2B2
MFLKVFSVVTRATEVTRRHTILPILLAIQLLVAVRVAAQTSVKQASDDTVLKQIIIFGRHGVRSPVTPNTTLATFAVRPYPNFGVPAGYLTPHGAHAETLLGSYFRGYLLKEGLLTPNNQEDARRSYFRANSIQRSNISAASLAGGLLPNVSVPVYSYPLGQPDPVFDPIGANVVTVDTVRAVNEVKKIFNDGETLRSANSAEFSLIRSVLFGYQNGIQPAPSTPSGLVDPTALPIPLTANTSGIATANVINSGGVFSTLIAADPFVMEYTDGLPLNNVGWGQLSLDTLSQQTRVINLLFDIEILPPYLNEVQSSNAASHVLRSMEQAVVGQTIPGAFGKAKTRLLVINSSDGYVIGLAGLLHLHWLLPGYQPDYCPPGGSLVFELRKSKSSGEYIVRAFYTAQTFDQLRDLTSLTLDQPPATVQLLIPNGSKSATNLDVKFGKFEQLLKKAINPKYVENPTTEVPPGPLTGVPLQ